MNRDAPAPPPDIERLSASPSWGERVLRVLGENAAASTASIYLVLAAVPLFIYAKLYTEAEAERLTARVAGCDQQAADFLTQAAKLESAWDKEELVRRERDPRKPGNLHTAHVDRGVAGRAHRVRDAEPGPQEFVR
jgi:hypothetical protein